MNTLRLVGKRNIIRNFSTGVRAMNESLPSNPKMKSLASWANRQDSGKDTNTVISKVVGMARSLQENTQPPVNINSTFTKKFNFGDTYDPFDFSSDKLDIERRERRQASQSARKADPFERSGVDPLDVYTMPEILSKFLSLTGQILPRDLTGCTPNNQRKLVIAVKRARACGLLSSVHKHSRYLPLRNM